MRWQDAPVTDVGPRWATAPELDATPEGSAIGGVAAEAGKGVLRGASDVGFALGEMAANMFLGPYTRAAAGKFTAPLFAKLREPISAKPAGDVERFAGTAGEIVGGSAAGGGLGRVRAALGTGAAALGGAAGEQVAGETGELVGAFLPATAGAAGRLAMKSVSEKAASNVGPFRDIGAKISLGQATDSAFLHGLENLASKFPGGSGVMKKFIDAQQRAIGVSTQTGTTAETAGRAIEKGITGKGGFLARTKATWNQLDDAVAAKIPKGAAFQPANTTQALDDLTRPVVGAEKTTGALVNPKIAEMQANLADDLNANNGQIPFEALRALRSKVGSMMDESLVTGIPGGELKKVYAALSKDLEAAAKQAGAGREFARQNNFYRARMSRIEDVLERVIGKGRQPEDIFKAIDPIDVNQVNKLRLTMRSLQPAEREVVTSAVVNRLGRATPGKQTELGDVFSSETFLTNWNRLSQGARQQLFPDTQIRTNMNRIAAAASDIRTGRGIYANPSGTAGSFAAYAVYMGPIAAVGWGLGRVPGAVAASAASAATANIGAKLLTNQKIVNWLAKPVTPSRPGDVAMHLGRLIAIYKNEDDSEMRSEIARFIQSVQPPTIQ